MDEPQSLGSFKAQSVDGKPVAMSRYAGQAALVVNTASQCGFTPQFAGLESLWQSYRDRGLVVLGFPCNQFGQQEPGENHAIASFCQLNYGVTFPMIDRKTHV